MLSRAPTPLQVTVTAHAASQQEGPSGSVQEWRVLRFNGVTRQSVARVTISRAERAGSIDSSSNGDGASRRSQNGAGSPAAPAAGEWHVEQQADCLAPPYLKSAAALSAALLGLQGLVPITGLSRGAAPALRLLCIGVGGGSLPLFLAHHFPQARVAWWLWDARE